MSSPCTDILAHIDQFIDTPTLVNAATTCQAWERRTRPELARRAAQKVAEDLENYRRVVFFSVKRGVETSIEGHNVQIQARLVDDPTNAGRMQLICDAPNVPGCANTLSVPGPESFQDSDERFEVWELIVLGAVRRHGLYLYNFFGPLPH